MTLLNFTLHDNVIGIKGYLEKLKDFALAQGWTVDDYEVSKNWVITSGFVAGDEDFLQISSTGFGSQNLVFRFRAEDTAADALSEWLQVGAHKATDFDFTSGTHPVQRDGSGTANWNARRYTSYHPSSIPIVWFFGNDKFIFSAAKHSNTTVVYQCFGSVELSDTTEAEGDFCPVFATTPSAANKWYTNNIRVPWDMFATSLQIFLNGVQASSTTSVKMDFNVAASPTPYGTQNAFGSSGKIINSENTYSERRGQLKQVLYALDTGDSQWFPFGTMWIYRVNTNGRQLAQEVTFGAQKYLVFPNPNTDGVNAKGGIAVRIA